ncbi:RNase A-like domain-containing protein [Paraburkholderia susongensis]|uniref:Bacterial CdiA-CT RNAse A domain-containing protein n=1 Tax=Paraburkholderia susongensis TaxID=1515439 RepID=A0A1X7LGW5_9BURK|nr:RNase A-like domain-containing protein [Paraburkholderia susongensis]SMG53101.1 hypothetical protein SAMN06265784_10685 [Paraburkholderia susongensis]
MSAGQDRDGVRVVFSAPQLAAMLARVSISETETLSNRLWGGLQVVGGVLEMVGAGALCVLPEPTMASKAGCVAFGLHGSDTAASGLRQLWTGTDTQTLTQRGTAKLAEAMKVSPDMANNIGLSLDIAVPFGFAGSIRAARVARVTMGRINLEMHEAKAGSGIGGHTLEKHVGKDKAWLQARLAREPRREMVSSFFDRQAAEWAISGIMQKRASDIQAWTRPGNASRTLQLVGETGRTVGYGLVRETGKMIELSKVEMFLRKERYNGMPYYVVTAFLVK